MKISRLFLLIIILLILIIPTEAQIKKVGTAGFAFLEIPVTASQSALGDAYIAMNSKLAEGILTNPASLSHIPNQSFMISYAPWFADMKHESIAYGLNFGDLGALGFSAVILDMGEMQGAVLDKGNPKGYRRTSIFSAKAWSFGISYSRRLTDLFSYGITIKYVKEGLSGVELSDGGKTDFYASNVLADAGILYYTGYKSLRIAVTAQNFGFDTKYVGATFNNPITFRIGAAMDFLGGTNPNLFTVLIEAIHPSDYSERLNFGLEYSYNKTFFLRTGYKFNYDEESYTLGAGIRREVAGFPSQVDFAYNNFGRLGKILRFTIQTSFK